MNVSLTPQLEDFVKDKVKSGRYSSASEVVREALRMLEERDRRLVELRKEIAIGLEDVEAGRVAPLDMEAIKRDGRRLLAEQQAKIS